MRVFKTAISIILLRYRDLQRFTYSYIPPVYWFNAGTLFCIMGPVWTIKKFLTIKPLACNQFVIQNQYSNSYTGRLGVLGTQNKPVMGASFPYYTLPGICFIDSKLYVIVSNNKNKLYISYPTTIV